MQHMNFHLFFCFFVFINFTFSENLFPDGDFESDYVEWNFFITKGFSDMGSKFEIQKENVYEGVKALALSSDDFSRFNISSDFIEVQPSKKYKLSGYVKVNQSVEVKTGQYGGGLRITYRNHDKKTRTDIFLPILGINGKLAMSSDEISLLMPFSHPFEWTKIEGSILIPDDVSLITVDCICVMLKGTMYFDNVKLTLDE